MFRNAHHFVVNGGQFTTINMSSDQDSVSTTLWQQVAAGAIFDSAERYPPGKCHPGTRCKMIEKISQWVNDRNPAQRVLWLHGPAGSGKSALAHSMCELLRDSRPADYGGSFFFSRGPTDRGNGLKLFTTLSYQLALQYPSMRMKINRTLQRDPSLPTKSMEVQLLSLIIQPLLCCEIVISHIPTIIIDGLDECADDDQRGIIILIAKSFAEYDLPLRFMIASRPESWIRDAFETAPLPSFTVPLSLRDDLDIDKDIKAYLTDEFEQIRLENKRVMGSVVLPWPPTDLIDHFVYEASGQYIYASTVLKFVGKHSKFSNPQEQLRIITSPGPHHATAFSELDRLYAAILSAYPRWETMKCVLGGLLVDANATTIEVALDVDHTELTLVLDGLSSVIDIKQSRILSEYEMLLEPIFGSLSGAAQTTSFCHLSFRHFLEDKMWSGPFHVDVGDIGGKITEAFFSIIHRNLDQAYKMEPYLFLKIDLIAYHRMMSDIITYTRENFQIEKMLPLINKMTQRLLSTDVGRSINNPGCFLRDLEYLYSLSIGIKLRLDHSATFDKDQTKTREILQFSILELQNAVSQAQDMAVRVLSLFNHYKISTTLVYIKLFSDCDGTTAKKLFTIPGNTIPDTLVSLRQYRNILSLDDLDGSWTVQLLDRLIFVDPSNRVDEGWPPKDEWRDQRISLTYHCLKSLMDNVDNDWEHTDVDVKFRHTFIKSIVFADFFDDHGGIWNISSKEFFDNPYNLALLDLMANSTAWTRWLPLRSKPRIEIENVISPVLCWFNRQLTDQRIIGIIKNHDETLLQKMTNAMREIFYHCFVKPNFLKPYLNELCVTTFIDEKWHTKWLKIRVRPLPQPLLHWEEGTFVYSPFGDRDIFRVHRELFGKTSPNMVALDQYLIERSHWYPHFAAHLLNSLVRCLYCRAAQTYLRSDYDSVASSFQMYIIECLPYAQTTQENLDALRAIVYFSQKETSQWRPPIGFCSLTRQFLKNYERIALSLEELKLFDKWMSNLQRLEVDSRCEESFTIPYV